MPLSTHNICIGKKIIAAGFFRGPAAGFMLSYILPVPFPDSFLNAGNKP